MKEQNKNQKPVIEEVGAYYPGMVVTSKEQAESTRGGISTFDIRTGKTKESEPKPKTS